MNKAESLLKQLTLEEKIGMLHGGGLFKTHGVERLGIPPLVFSDGPMGVRNEFENDRWIPCSEADSITYLPSGSALASTWNPELAAELGQVLGAEMRGRGKDVVLAPGINIKRSPLCGRNFEYMSEDPVLISEMVVPLIKGIEESDVAACVKHFALNNQETKRVGVDVVVDDRALREIYLPAFEAAIKTGGSSTVMCAYNRYKGIYAGHSAELLDKILTDEWGFDGPVVSDWGALHDTEEAARVHMDLDMTCLNETDKYYFGEPLLEAVKDGRVNEEDVDKKVLRILRLMEKLKMLGGNRKSGCYNIPEHRVSAYKAAAESVVLLKNEKKRLPLNRENLKKILVIGDNAIKLHSGAGGSAEIKALYEINPLMGLCGRLGGNTEVRYARGYNAEIIAETEESWQAISPETGSSVVEALPPPDDIELRREAVKLAAEYDEVIFIGGLNHVYDMEGADRRNMILPYRQDELINEILAVNPNTIIVMTAGSPVDMSMWADKAKAIVWCWYAGCEGGHALADVLIGNINPCGHLPETFAKRLEDCPAHRYGEFPGGDKVRYNEGNKVGYRGFDTDNITPLFAFGHGLSYTDFSISNLKISDNGEIKVSCLIENTGECEGKAVIQLYVSPTEPNDRPMQALRAFKKISLAPLQKNEVHFLLNAKDFAYYDGQRFVSPAGIYKIRLGLSSRDIRLSELLNYKGNGE